MNEVYVIVISSVSSSILTATIAYLIFHFFGKKKIERELGEYAQVIKEKIREGVEEAGRELMPEFRSEVREGFKGALGSTLNGEMMDETVRSLTKSGSTFMESGLNLLFGRAAESSLGEKEKARESEDQDKK